MKNKSILATRDRDIINMETESYKRGRIGKKNIYKVGIH